MIGIKDQCFGVEVEMTGLTRKAAAQALAEYFGTAPHYHGGVYDSWSIQDPVGKTWKVMRDSSIRAERKTADGYERVHDSDYQVELVTPKLTYAEMPKFQECVRQVRKAGAKVNDSCGLHVHVDAADHNRQSLKNLIGIMYSKEDILFKALQVNEARAERWCKKVREPMLREARRLSSDETKDFTKLEEVWYEGDVSTLEHYNWTRYHALNLHSVFYRGTVALFQLHPPRRTGGGVCEPMSCHLRSGHCPAQHSHEKNAQRQRAVHLPGLAGAPWPQRGGVQKHPEPPPCQSGRRPVLALWKGKL